MSRKLRTKRGLERYSLRMETAEPALGQIKQGRGFRQFLPRGLEKVNGEWSLVCTGHNLLKLVRHGSGRPGKVKSQAPAGTDGRSPRLPAGKIFCKFPALTNPFPPQVPAYR